MLQLFILCLALLFTSSCGSDAKIITNSETGFIEFQKSQDKKTSIPTDYIKCPEMFYWNVPKFIKNISMHKSTQSNYKDQMDIITEFPSSIAMGSGMQTSFFNLNLSDNEKRLCLDIYKMLSGIFRESRIYQFFEYEDVKEIISSSDEFKEIAEKSAIIEKILFDFDNGAKTKIYKNHLILPVSVACEKKWSVKRDPESDSRAIFKEPEGKCNFSLHGQELILPSNEKVLITITGYYEADPEYPTEKTLIMIEKYGFKYLSQ